MTRAQGEALLDDLEVIMAKHGWTPVLSIVAPDRVTVSMARIGSQGYHVSLTATKRQVTK
jgi:hypothetical protein